MTHVTRHMMCSATESWKCNTRRAQLSKKGPSKGHCFYQGAGRVKWKETSKGEERYMGCGRQRGVRKGKGKDIAETWREPNYHVGCPFSSTTFAKVPHQGAVESSVIICLFFQDMSFILACAL